MPEIELYLQTIFTLLDVLGRWVKESWSAAKAAAQVAASATAKVGQSVSRLVGWLVG